MREACSGQENVSRYKEPSLIEHTRQAERDCLCLGTPAKYGRNLCTRSEYSRHGEA